jgi:hypothetical protein
VDDAVHIMRQFRGKQKEQLYLSVKRYQPVSPFVPVNVFRQRFDDIWQKIFG